MKNISLTALDVITVNTFFNIKYIHYILLYPYLCIMGLLHIYLMLKWHAREN